MFYGPLEFLLELVRRHEIDLVNLPLNDVADQYLAYLNQLVDDEGGDYDLELSGEFLVQASMLLDWKTTMLLERGAAKPTDEDETAASLGVFRHLIEHHRFAFLALTLAKFQHARSRMWGRPPGLIPQEELDDVYLDDVDINMLAVAIARLTRETKLEIATIRYDDRPIADHMDELRRILAERQRLGFREYVTGEGSITPDRGRVVGSFLAVLELVRMKEATVEQASDGGGGGIVLGWVPPSERIQPDGVMDDDPDASFSYGPPARAAVAAANDDADVADGTDSDDDAAPPPIAEDGEVDGDDDGDDSDDGDDDDDVDDNDEVVADADQHAEADEPQPARDGDTGVKRSTRVVQSFVSDEQPKPADD